MKRKVFGIKTCLQDLLKDNESIEDFEFWAFGKDCDNFNGEQLLKAWNTRHYKMLKLKADGNIYEDLEKMIDLWRYQKSPSVGFEPTTN